MTEPRPSRQADRESGARLAGLQRPSSLLLLAVNVIPIIGVLYWGWQVGNLLLLYWAETLIIGLFNLAKIMSARGDNTSANRVDLPGLGNLFTAAFFTLHFGGFVAAHFFVLNEVFDIPPLDDTLLFTLSGITLSHAFSYVWNWERSGERKRATPSGQMARPYGRVVIMHVAVLIGAVLMDEGRGSIAALVVLVIVKTVFDVFAHIEARLSAQEAAQAAC